MKKYRETLEKLSDGQKISLLTNDGFLASPEAAEAGLPHLEIASFEEAAKAEELFRFSFDAAANSWNTELIGKRAETLALAAKGKGINALISPPANVKSNLYGTGATEDPFLAGALAGAYMSAVSRTGLMPCLSLCALDETDADFADTLLNERALKEYFLKSFESAAHAMDGGAIVTSRAALKGEYAAVNGGVIDALLHEGFGKEKFILCDCDGADSRAAVLSLRGGDAMCLHASPSSLEGALGYYRALKKSESEGSVSPEEVETACREGAALSEEELDEAADRALDFAFACDNGFHALKKTEENRGESKESAEEIALRLAEESVVLLKNEGNILPLKAGSRVAVIGQAAFFSEGRAQSFMQYLSAADEAAGFQFVGYADGYEIGADRSDALIPEACELARTADVALVFLGPGARREDVAASRCVKLPPNQLALVDAIGKVCEKTIAVTTDDCQTDMSFDKRCAAVLVSPPLEKYGAQALINLLTGRSNPSGKLAATRYDDADETFAQLRLCKRLGKNKVGTFFGYRHYDTSGISARYPFGFGLSYTKFEYSELRESKEEVRFLLKNTGEAAGAEIVQVYVGKQDSEAIRPRKELKGFAKIYLQAGESTEVCVKFGPDDFVIFDEKGNPVTERGEYQVYVGASVSDVRLTGRIFVEGETLGKNKETLSEYLQAKSNILAGGYTMKKRGVRGSRNARKFALISSIAAAAYDLLFWIYLQVVPWNITPFEGQDPIADCGLILLFPVNAVMIASLVVLLIDYWKKKKQRLAAPAETEETEEETLEETEYEKLFTQEFENQPEEEALPVEKEEEARCFDGKTTMKQVCEEFSAFAGERGIAVEFPSARAVFSAMSASRLVLLKSNESSLLPAFVSLLGEYFGAEAFRAEAAEYTSADDALICLGENGTYKETPVAKALKAAADSDFRIHIAYLNGADLSSADAWLAPFARYASHPEKAGCVALKEKRLSDKSYPLSPNLWFFVGIKEGYSIEELPPFVGETAFAVEVRLSKIEEKEEKTPFQAPRYSRFVRLGEESENNFMLSEEKWKKVDKLEDYVKGVTEGKFRIGNKAWRNMEKFVGAFLACGGEETDALDSVTASKLLPFALPLLSEKPNGKIEFLRALGNILGEENMPQCRRWLEGTDVGL